MNIDSILEGLFFLLIGLIGLLFDKPLTAQQTKERRWGLSEAKIKIGKWSLIISGTLLIIYGILNE
jgi:hypothetical protein